MSSNSSRAVMLSAMLHGLVVALVLIFTYALRQQVKEPPKIFELVAGEGDNYGATAAPALGTPGGVKIAIPAPVAPKVEPAPPSPVTPAPVVAPAPATKPPPDAIPDLAKSVKRISAKRRTRLEAKYKAEARAEARREKAEEARKARAEAEAQKNRMTKAEFDRLNQGKSVPAPRGRRPAKVSHIDAEGIARGVIGGSTANKVGGAGGKALTRAEGDLLDAYFSLLRRRLHEALDKPPGLSDTLVAAVEFRIAADGTLSGARIVRTSGSDEFDRAVLAAFAHVRTIGPRPDGKSELLTLNFRMREE
jgi:colicin import membrane protein